MQRTTLVAEIFGYLVCLFTVAVFFASIAGIVNNAFRVGNPTAGPRVLFQRHIGPPGGGNIFFRAQTQGRMPNANRGGPMQVPVPPGAGPNAVAIGARFVGDARYDAVRRLVLSIVMLIASILVFRRTFAWLNASG